MHKPVHPVLIAPPPANQRLRRGARFATDGERKNRYHLPDRLESGSPVGFRTRVSLSTAESKATMKLLSMPRPTGFGEPTSITDQELFEESSLGILSARQSTNFRGHRMVTVGPKDTATVSRLLKRLQGIEGTVLDNASYCHLVLARPYRTAFTGLLTFIGHEPVKSLFTVAKRAWRKRIHHEDDIPTIGYLTQLHIGILADAMERATPIASEGARRSVVFSAPFAGPEMQSQNQATIEALLALTGITSKERRQGWQLALVAQAGTALPNERIDDMPEGGWRRVGATLLALRSERIQPGVNQEPSAPASYQGRQDMDVPEELTVMCGRAAYNAYVHWTGVERGLAKDRMMLERVDVLSPGGKRRLREIRGQLSDITDKICDNLPLWVDLPSNRLLSKNAARGKKAFALAGQRIYIVGLAKNEVATDGTAWDQAVRAVGAATSRAALVAEIMGTTEVPEDCDLLAGICLMAGPVNQNDIGKSFYGYRDLLAGAFPGRDPTSLLVFTLKAKTVADPIGNEEQLMNPKRKGALVDLRAAPHDVVSVRQQGVVQPFRKEGALVSAERAYSDVGNFVTDPSGRPIPGNEGRAWPRAKNALW